MTSLPLMSTLSLPPRPGSSPDISPRQAADNELSRSRGFTPGPLHRARCECRRCGVHMITDVGFKVAASCRNCGSFELVPIADA